MVRSQTVKRRGRRLRDRGVAAVEFALVLPLFLLLILGGMDFGWFFFVDQIVTNASREGARAGSVVLPSLGSGVALNKADEAARDYLARGGLGGAPTITTATDVIGGATAIRVTIDYPVGSLTGFLGPIMPENASATSVMRW